MRLVTLVLFATAAFGQTYISSTFAGVWLPENLPGASVSLDQIDGVAVDVAGNVFLSLPRYAVVMRLDATTGILTRFAENTTNGFSGDNGPAVNAQLYGPTGLALDLAGNLYLADTNNRRVRKVSNGVITTIAGNGLQGVAGEGGPATSAALSTPMSVAVDAAGSLYIHDVSTTSPISPPPAFPGDPIRGDLSGNIYDANNNVAGFVPAVGIAIDPSGNVYRSDGIHILVLTPTGLLGPPTSVSVDFVNNVASNQFLGIAPGEIVTLKGSGLGPAQLVSASVGSDGFYPTQLSGTSVQFNGVAVPRLYTSGTQVAAVTPYGVTGPSVQVTVTYQNQTSVPATIQVFAAAPGLFTAAGSGAGQAAAINQDGTINSASNPAPMGSIISLYATGGGQIWPGGMDGQLSTVPLSTQSLPVPAYIGLQPVIPMSQLQYAGPAPGEIAGLMQINVPLPLSLTPGSAVPVEIFVGIQLSSSQSNVTTAVR